MFNTKCLELVKVLHEIPMAYKPSDYDIWDNNVGECKAWFFDICRYEWGQPIPCCGCDKHTHKSH